MHFDVSQFISSNFVHLSTLNRFEFWRESNSQFISSSLTSSSDQKQWQSIQLYVIQTLVYQFSILTLNIDIWYLKLSVVISQDGLRLKWFLPSFGNGCLFGAGWLELKYWIARLCLDFSVAIQLECLQLGNDCLSHDETIVRMSLLSLSLINFHALLSTLNRFKFWCESIQAILSSILTSSSDQKQRQSIQLSYKLSSTGSRWYLELSVVISQDGLRIEFVDYVTLLPYDFVWLIFALYNSNKDIALAQMSTRVNES